MDSLTLYVTNTMMKRWFQFFKHKAYDFRWAILSGILVGTSYIPFPPWALIFCYTPLWIYVTEESSSVKKSFWAGWVTQFILTLIGFHWIAYTAHEFGQLPWAVSYLALLLFCAFMHLYIPVAVAAGTWLRLRFKLSGGQTLFTIALLHALLERTWPVIFEWHLGYTLIWSKIPMYHLADLVGFHGLSAVVLLFNAWMGYVWLKQSFVKKALSHLSLLALTFAALVGWGFWHGKAWNKFDGETKATVVQANIGNLEKIYAEQGRAYQEVITRKFLDLSFAAMQKYPQTDILIWPETAFPDYLDQHLLDRKHAQILISGLQPLSRPLITGAYSKDPKADEKQDTSTYNALFLVDPLGNNLDKPYRKTELLAFGEYLPLSEQFPFLLKLLPFVSNFGRGHGPEVMKWDTPQGSVRWGGQICYEGLYPSFTRGLAEKGADILVNVTNDSWFGKTFEPQQHLYMTLARAIEVRRPLVRSTNTGVSTAVLANGDVLQKSPLHEEWSGQFVIKYLKNAPLTFFVQWGHWDWIVILLVLGAVIGRGALNARSRRS
ncbi:Carbon-nitrogen hydrolase: apolipoprotein N-acyltransferase [Bdellovibrio bacteriovorus HD100]|uniref:Apolipoprotein N-acyltransferase n=2 Tax=Bdellovibrio bacteriovorus TaxID=959 RepID=LNT_BDEBA|nr:RecName: Full=Apolipoprotein N-acyltransferase; Short=ALP N-acyltransferase [Bdellovibrio bacteriovorus HD100]CAE79175.1 Carbon-nitrogen hydrolase: apolipoprotein N-acyltransferase [Bdellovibrio bacteriovorus HD100]